MPQAPLLQTVPFRQSPSELHVALHIALAQIRLPLQVFADCVGHEPLLQLLCGITLPLSAEHVAEGPQLTVG
jgi:hypothetical protein